MITCYLKYVIDPYKLKEFEHYAKLWIPLVDRLGGKHHGYFMPHEGANNIALALFSFHRLPPTKPIGRRWPRIPNVRRPSAMPKRHAAS